MFFGKSLLQVIFANILMKKRMQNITFKRRMIKFKQIFRIVRTIVDFIWFVYKIYKLALLPF